MAEFHVLDAACSGDYRVSPVSSTGAACSGDYTRVSGETGSKLHFSEPMRRTVRPGGHERFVVDVPSSTRHCSLRLSMQRRGGDPVLMASCGEWPTVDLDGAADDLVRAHYVAFEHFQSDDSTHELLIPSAERPRTALSRRQPAPLAAFPAAENGTTRWAVCVFNFPLARHEDTAICIVVKLETDAEETTAQWQSQPSPNPSRAAVVTDTSQPWHARQERPRVQEWSRDELGSSDLTGVEAQFLALASGVGHPGQSAPEGRHASGRVLSDPAGPAESVGRALLPTPPVAPPRGSLSSPRSSSLEPRSLGRRRSRLGAAVFHALAQHSRGSATAFRLATALWAWRYATLLGNTYSRIPVAQPQEYESRIPPGLPCI